MSAGKRQGVGELCGRESSGAASLRQTVRAKKRHQYADVYARLDDQRQTRASSLYRAKDGPVIPFPQPPHRPSSGLACARCCPLSRECWQDPKGPVLNSTVISILDIGRQYFTNTGVISRYFCDLAQYWSLATYDFKDLVPEVIKDNKYQEAIEDKCQQEFKMIENGGSNDSDAISKYKNIRQQVEAKAAKVLIEISSAMSTNVLRFVLWVCHKAIRRVAAGSCGSRVSCLEPLRRAQATGLPLVFVPLHRSYFDNILVSFTLYLAGLRPPLVAVTDNINIPFFGWLLRHCGAFFIRRYTGALDHPGDCVYESALRAYIRKSLEAKNNLQFFIERDRAWTGKPQLPKASVLSVIIQAYLDGTIDDALLVPVTLNYDRLVDGNFVNEQLGKPQRMETLWSTLRGIWHALSTNHGGIRVHFNQPISLKELVTSLQKLNYLTPPFENTLSPMNNNSSAIMDRQILYNHSSSSQCGANVSSDHKMMIEAIGRHLVYDAAQSTALMSTNVVSYVLLTELRGGATVKQLQECVEKRGNKLLAVGRDLGYAGEPRQVLHHALDILGRSLVGKSGSGEMQQVSVCDNIHALLELSYYANTVAAYYAPQAIVATALESIIRQPNADPEVIRHSELMEASLQLCVILNQEFILCAPCKKTEELLNDTIQGMISEETFTAVTPPVGLQEQEWSRRFAKSLEEEDDEERDDPTIHIKYKVSHTSEANAERSRLILTLRPLLEAYATTCRCLTSGTQDEVVKKTLGVLMEDYGQKRLTYGEAVSAVTIHNCLRLLEQWGVIDINGYNSDRTIKIRPQYETQGNLDIICNIIHKFNMTTPLLTEAYGVMVE